MGFPPCVFKNFWCLSADFGGDQPKDVEQGCISEETDWNGAPIPRHKKQEQSQGPFNQCHLFSAGVYEI